VDHRNKGTDRKIHVFYPDGRWAYQTTVVNALHSQRAGVLRVYVVKGKVKLARLFDGPNRPRAGQRETVNYETPENPRGVWTFRKPMGIAQHATR
jgi:hypothetical protein